MVNLFFGTSDLFKLILVIRFHSCNKNLYGKR